MPKRDSLTSLVEEAHSCYTLPSAKCNTWSRQAAHAQLIEIAEFYYRHRNTQEKARDYHTGLIVELSDSLKPVSHIFMC